MTQQDAELLAAASEKLRAKFHGHLGGKPDMLKSSMVIAYEKGLKDHLVMLQEAGFDIVRRAEEVLSEEAQAVTP